MLFPHYPEQLKKQLRILGNFTNLDCFISKFSFGIKITTSFAANDIILSIMWVVVMTKPTCSPNGRWSSDDRFTYWSPAHCSGMLYTRVGAPNWLNVEFWYFSLTTGFYMLQIFHFLITPHTALWCCTPTLTIDMHPGPMKTCFLSPYKNELKMTYVSKGYLENKAVGC